MTRPIIIGTRGSDLALWQANHVRSGLENLGYAVQINIITTRGDQIQHLGFDKMEGKGFFTKELEAALLAGDIDLAVHSHKDLETTLPEGLILAAVTERADPADVLLIAPEAEAPDMTWHVKAGARFGTSSARRKSLILHHRPDVTVHDLRGNVPTRLQKLYEGQYDAIVVAKAGLDRLEADLSEFRVLRLNPETFIPAPAQGALALQIRAVDVTLMRALAPLHHMNTANCIAAERSVLAGLSGGCLLPLGAFCIADEDAFSLYASHAHTASGPVRFFSISGPDPGQLAVRMVALIKSR